MSPSAMVYAIRLTWVGSNPSVSESHCGATTTGKEAEAKLRCCGGSPAYRCVADLSWLGKFLLHLGRPPVP